MTKYFTAIAKENGEEWKSKNGEFLVMFQSGQVGVCKNNLYYGRSVEPLDMSKYWIKPKECFVDRIKRSIKFFNEKNKHTV